MAFEKNTAYEKRIEFKNGANASVFEYPKANFFAGMTLDINLAIAISDGAMVGVLQQQIGRCIEKLEIIRDGDNTVWQISGEQLSRRFRYREGVQAVDNAEIPVDVDTAVAGRLFLDIPFHPLDAVKPSDYAMDTNKHKYELKIKFRNITLANVLFKTVSGGTITVDTANSFIDLTLYKLTPVRGPNGDDQYTKQAPYFPGIIERIDTVAATKPDFEIELPENKVVRGVTVFAETDAASGLDPGGSNSVLTDSLTLKNTQGRTIQNVKATTLRQLTSLKRKAASLEAGLLDYDFTQYGHIVDSLLSDGIAPLKIVGAVAKLTYDTRIVSVVETVEQQ